MRDQFLPKIESNKKGKFKRSKLKRRSKKKENSEGNKFMFLLKIRIWKKKGMTQRINN